MANRILSFSAAVSSNTDAAIPLAKNIPRITLRQLIYFAAAANQESALRAAEELNVSPPAISGAISSLESLLGEQLFIRRHARGLVLTKAGQHLLSDAQDIIGRVNEIEAVRQRTPLRTRRLMVGCLADIAPALLPPLIKTFEQDNPDVEIRWHMSDHGDLMQRLEESTLDLAIVIDFEISPILLSTVLQPAPALCVLPQGHRLSATPISLSDLASEPYIMLDIPRTRDYFLSIFGSLGLQPNIAHRAASAEMVRSLVANGFGYSLLNFTMQRQAGITYSPLIAEPRPSNLVAVRQHRRRPSPLLEHFIRQAKQIAAACRITGA